MVVGCFAFDVFVPGLPEIARELGIDQSQTQWLISAISLGTTVTLLVCGTLADAYGRKRVLLGFLGVMLMASAAVCFPQPYGSFIMWRFVQGIGCGVTFVMGFTLIADVCDHEKRPIYISYLSASLTLFLALAPILGGYMIHYWGWRSTFILIFAMTAVALAVVYFCLPETLKTCQKPDWIELLSSYKQMVSSKGFLGFGLTPGLMIGASVGYLSLASHYLIRDFGLSEVSYGWYQSIFMFVQGGLGLMLGRIIRKWGVEKVLRFSVFCGFISSLLFMLATWLFPHVLWLQTLCMILFTLGINASIVTHIDKGLSLFPSALGTASALQGALRGFVIACAVQIGGFMVIGEPVSSLGSFVFIMGGLVLIVYFALTRKSIDFH
jgi:DHA1 family bicyclomycin/chloramphenicol resistance-like MFS transporter